MCAMKCLLFTFNVILETGVIPTDWCIGVIQPIYKNKGCENNPDNHRGITLLTCMGKLCTSLLNNRLSNYLKMSSMLGVEQAGFRSGYSALDHLFSLHVLIDMYLQSGKRICCALIDYQKAFDLV